jgi:hypothetical protein
VYVDDLLIAFDEEKEISNRQNGKLEKHYTNQATLLI